MDCDNRTSKAAGAGRSNQDIRRYGLRETVVGMARECSTAVVGLFGVLFTLPSRFEQPGKIVRGIHR